MGHKKLVCIGAGNVGGEIASHLALYELGDIVLIESPEREGIAKGKACDIQHACALTGSDVDIIGSCNPADIQGASVCIISAGFPRGRNESREALFERNAGIIRETGKAIQAFAPQSLVIVITNPPDPMTYATWKASGLPSSRVIGMAGMLDSARFRSLVARAAGCSVKDVNALVLGGHGDLMVPVFSHCTIHGVPVTEMVDDKTLWKIVEQTRSAGGDIVKLMGTSAYYAAAESAVLMAKSYLLDQKRVMPCSVLLEGHYGMSNLYMGVPSVIGSNGVERILEIRLSEKEHEMLIQSAGKSFDSCRTVDLFLKSAEGSQEKDPLSVTSRPPGQNDGEWGTSFHVGRTIVSPS